MTIFIEPSALHGPSDDLLKSGALYGLVRLQELGHTLSFDKKALSPAQQKLLDNESVTAEQEEAGLTIASKNGDLIIKYTGEDAEEVRNWQEAVQRICFPSRKASLKRSTSETDIELELNLDGSGKADINTGLPFFDHMLEQIAKHGLVDLSLSCKGDLEVDEHHTIEDTAIALGAAISKALGDKRGIQRYAFVLPMDESQCRIALDLSGRPYLTFEGRFSREMIGGFPTEMVRHFFYSLAVELRATLQIKVEGANDHHQIEACFKGFARCLRGAVSRNERNMNILPTTKNLL